MSKPIKETPILTSRDAVNFYEKKAVDEKFKKKRPASTAPALSPTPLLPEAQPLEGVKTENENASKEFKTIEQLMVELQDKMHYDTYPSDEQPPIYKIEYLTGDYFPLHMVKKVCEAYHAQFATDAGGGKDLVMLAIENGYQTEIGQKAFIHGYTLTAPSTHSSSEMVEKEFINGNDTQEKI